MEWRDTYLDIVLRDSQQLLIPSLVLLLTFHLSDGVAEWRQNIAVDAQFWFSAQPGVSLLSSVRFALDLSPKIAEIRF